jgi:5-methylcytosine-specific restriction endonuclease McrA
VALEVHHIDGDPSHDVAANLIPLCGRCHSLAGADAIL